MASPNNCLAPFNLFTPLFSIELIQESTLTYFYSSSSGINCKSYLIFTPIIWLHFRLKFNKLFHNGTLLVFSQVCNKTNLISFPFAKIPQFFFHVPSLLFSLTVTIVYPANKLGSCPKLLNNYTDWSKHNY